MRRIVAITLFCLICAASGFAECVEVSTSEPYAQLASPNIQITTTLVNRPMENARVDIYFTGAKPSADVTGRKPYLILETNKDGIVSASALPAGNYHVIASGADKFKTARTELYLNVSGSAKAASFSMELWPNTAWTGGPRDRAVGEAASADNHVKEFRGIVTDFTAASVSGAVIRILRRTPAEVTPTMEIKTDEPGRFAATLPNGTYVAYVLMNGFRAKALVFEVSDKAEAKDRYVQLEIMSC